MHCLERKFKCLVEAERRVLVWGVLRIGSVPLRGLSVCVGDRPTPSLPPSSSCRLGRCSPGCESWRELVVPVRHGRWEG